MREIKFRAWDCVTKKMLSDFHLFGEVTLLGGIHSWQHKEAESIGINRNTIAALGDLVEMQFTGLKDRNGLDVYEDDIVYWKHLNLKAVVYYNDDEVHYYAKPLPNDEDKTEIYLDSVTMEIIGNIYENPDLLK